MSLPTFVVNAENYTLDVLGDMTIKGEVDSVFNLNNAEEHQGEHIENLSKQYSQIAKGTLTEIVDGNLNYITKKNYIEETRGTEYFEVKKQHTITIQCDSIHSVEGSSSNKVDGNMHNLYLDDLRKTTVGQCKDIIGGVHRVTIGKDFTNRVNGDEIINLVRDQVFNIGGSEYMVIGGESRSLIGGNNNITVGENIEERVSGTETTQVNQNYEINIQTRDNTLIKGDRISEITDSKTEAIKEKYDISSTKFTINSNLNVEGNLSCNLNGQISILNKKGGATNIEEWFKIPYTDVEISGNHGIVFNTETGCMKVQESGVYLFTSFVNFNFLSTPTLYANTRIRADNCLEEKVLLGSAVDANMQSSFINSTIELSNGTSIFFEYLSSVKKGDGLGAILPKFEQVFSNLSVTRIN